MPAAIATLKSFNCPPTNMQALVARLASVGRINLYQIYALHHGFVVQKLTQLIERPTIRASTFSLVSRLLVRSFPNTCQVFNRNCTVSLYCTIDNRPTDSVVHPSLESPLSTGQPFQTPFGALCAFRLKIGPDAGKFKIYL